MTNSKWAWADESGIGGIGDSPEAAQADSIEARS